MCAIPTKRISTHVVMWQTWRVCGMTSYATSPRYCYKSYAVIMLFMMVRWLRCPTCLVCTSLPTNVFTCMLRYSQLDAHLANSNTPPPPNRSGTCGQMILYPHKRQRSYVKRLPGLNQNLYGHTLR